MEKKQKNTFASGPWMLSNGHIKKFSPVTEINRKNMIVLGRILYIIEPSGSKFMFRGTMVIEPCFLKGEWLVPFRPWMNGYPGHYSSVFKEDMNYTTWAAINKAMIDGYIKEKTLYINSSDPILTFHRK